MRLTLLESRVTAVQKVVPILSRVVVADEKCPVRNMLND